MAPQGPEVEATVPVEAAAVDVAEAAEAVVDVAEAAEADAAAKGSAS